MPAAPILDYAEAMDSEQARAREMTMEIDHPFEGRVPYPGLPNKTAGYAPSRCAGPHLLLGQHTAEVLEEWGMDPARIEALRRAGAFGTFDEPIASPAPEEV